MNRVFHRGIDLLCIVLILPSLRAQQPKARALDPPKAKAAVEAVPAPTGVPYHSGGRRDPFLNPLLLRKAQKVVDEEMSRGQAPPGIAGMYESQVTLVGIASQNGSQTAIFRGTDKRAYFLHEGDIFFDGFLNKIGEDTVTLVRETKFRSGKVLKQEVTKRLRPQ